MQLKIGRKKNCNTFRTAVNILSLICNLVKKQLTRSSKAILWRIGCVASANWLYYCQMKSIYLSDTYLQNSMLHTNYILLKIKTFGFVLEFEMWSCGMNQTWHDICYIYFGGMYSLALMMSISTRTTCKNIDKINESFKTEFTRFTDYLNTFQRNNS